MKKLPLFTALSLFLCSAFTIAPLKSNVANIKVILKSGNPKEFKTHPKVNLKVVYDKLKVGDFNSEKEYINKKVKEANKKESGKGDAWLEKWENAKNNVWPRRFEELYNKVLEKKNLSCENGATDNEYTLVVSVTFIEPGFNVGVMSKPASANFEFNLYGKDSDSEPLAELYLNGVPGAQAMGYDFDSDTRVGESFAKGAKMLAAYINKQK